MSQTPTQEQNLDPKPLTEKEMHCIARMLQGSIFMENAYWACFDHCRYGQECAGEFIAKRPSCSSAVRKKLTKITGVYLDYLINKFEEEEGVVCEMGKTAYWPTTPHKEQQADIAP